MRNDVFGRNINGFTDYFISPVVKVYKYSIMIILHLY